MDQKSPKNLFQLPFIPPQPDIVVIGITQFVFLTIGILLLGVALKVSNPADITPMAAFLVHHGVWLLMIPLVWTALSEHAYRIAPKGWRYAIRGSGIVLAALIGLLFGISILANT